MLQNKMLRNAQTQHGDCRTVDEENIVVLRNCISPPQPQPPSISVENVLKFKNENDNDNTQENIKLRDIELITDPISSQNTQLLEPQCVWNFSWEPPQNKTDNSILQIENNDDFTPPSTNKDKRKFEEDNNNIENDLKKSKLKVKDIKLKRTAFTDDRYNETSYYFENGLRKVYPYYFTFTTFTKGRWIGEKILDVFAREFRAHPAEEYKRCIDAGSLTVNYEPVPIDYVLKHNDLLANIVHRHEVPITDQQIKIIHMDDDIVVVNKPTSIPVHPCGRYRHNTVVFILAKEYNLKNLRTIHRLDRLTSGILLFGRNPEKAREMEHQIRNRLVKKQYVCRVDGEFPKEIIDCTESIEVVSYKIGVCKVSSKGKDCRTTFERMGYNGKSSIVLCKPKTGRMHQIRVHLQYLGYPIVNDPLYNHEVFGRNKGRGGDIDDKTDEQLVQDLITIHNAESWLGTDVDSNISFFNKPIVNVENITNKTVERSSNSGLQEKNLRKDKNITIATQTGHEPPDSVFNEQKLTIDKHCHECKVKYRDPTPQDLIMYLHAWKYEGTNWHYETELPEWAKSDWVELDSNDSI